MPEPFAATLARSRYEARLLTPPPPEKGPNQDINVTVENCTVHREALSAWVDTQIGAGLLTERDIQWATTPREDYPLEKIERAPVRRKF